MFLLLYAGLGAVVVAVTWYLRRQGEDGKVPRLAFDDPCMIAYLRDGAAESVRVAALSLIDRGLLVVVGKQLCVPTPTEGDFVRKPIEKALLARLATPADGHVIADDRVLALYCSAYDAELSRRGLLPNAQQRLARLRLAGIAIGIMLIVASVKIAVALYAGRTSVAVLVVLAIAFSIALVKVMHPRRTTLGDRTLADLAVLFGRLQRRSETIQRGGTSNEAAILAAVFGLNVLPPVFGDAKFALATPSKERGGRGDYGAVNGCGAGSSGCGGGGGCGGCGGG